MRKGTEKQEDESAFPLWLHPRRSKIPAPRPFVTVDIESRDWQTIDLLGCYDPSRDQYQTFWRPDYLLRWLERYHRGSDVYAHYGGGFDFWFLLRHIAERWPDIELSRAGSAAVSAILVPSLDLRFVDSYALMPLSLRELCELCGVSGYVEVEDFDTVTDLELRARNEADCRCNRSYTEESRSPWFSDLPWIWRLWRELGHS